MAVDDVPDPKITTYRAIVDELGTALKTELTQTLQTGGPLAALSLCHENAPQIAAAISEKHHVDVGRTSLKLRNPNNAPDDWELHVLKAFAERKAKGEDPTKLEFYEILDKEGKKQIRYMKAIPVMPPCLICHGPAITPEVSAKLKTLYPDDKATGFQVGDLRGAFTLVVE